MGTLRIPVIYMVGWLVWEHTLWHSCDPCGWLVSMGTYPLYSCDLYGWLVSMGIYPLYSCDPCGWLLTVWESCVPPVVGWLVWEPTLCTHVIPVVGCLQYGNNLYPCGWLVSMGTLRIHVIHVVG